MKDIIDFLGWKLFENGVEKHMPKKVNIDNRLIFHTKNFFTIAGFGSFIKGYCLLIPKINLPSFAHIEDKYSNEINYNINIIKHAFNSLYNLNLTMFEHGLCSCVGGLDHAHLHLMPTSDIKKNQYINTINTIFKKRGVGINSILFQNRKLQNIEDIQSVLNNNFKYKILSGKIKSFEDLEEISIDSYPFSLSEFAKNNQHYNIFINYIIKFKTNLNIGTQLGREIVFKTELNVNIIQDLTKYKESIKNEYWKWQINRYDENIIHTIKDITLFLLDNKFTNFDFKISHKK